MMEEALMAEKWTIGRMRQMRRPCLLCAASGAAGDLLMHFACVVLAHHAARHQRLQEAVLLLRELRRCRHDVCVVCWP